MSETKAVVVSISITLLVAAFFCICQAHTENKVQHHSKIKSQGPCENQYKKHCLNDGECYYLVDEDIVGGNCNSFMKENNVKSTCGETRLGFKIEKDERSSIENLTRCKNF